MTTLLYSTGCRLGTCTNLQVLVRLARCRSGDIPYLLPPTSYILPPTSDLRHRREEARRDEVRRGEAAEGASHSLSGVVVSLCRYTYIQNEHIIIIIIIMNPTRLHCDHGLTFLCAVDGWTLPVAGSRFHRHECTEWMIFSWEKASSLRRPLSPPAAAGQTAISNVFVSRLFPLRRSCLARFLPCTDRAGASETH